MHKSFTVISDLCMISVIEIAFSGLGAAEMENAQNSYNFVSTYRTYRMYRLWPLAVSF